MSINTVGKLVDDTGDARARPDGRGAKRVGLRAHHALPPKAKKTKGAMVQPTLPARRGLSAAGKAAEVPGVGDSVSSAGCKLQKHG